MTEELIKAVKKDYELVKEMDSLVTDENHFHLWLRRLLRLRAIALALRVGLAFAPLMKRRSDASVFRRRRLR